MKNVLTMFYQNGILTFAVRREFKLVNIIF